MRAGTILHKAAEIVDGSRQKTHGDRERSFSVIANFWNAYIQGRRNPTAKIEDYDVASMMELLKIARAIQGDSAEVDHAIDGCGYAGLAGELRTKHIRDPEPVPRLCPDEPLVVNREGFLKDQKSDFSSNVSAGLNLPDYGPAPDITITKAQHDQEKMAAEAQLRELGTSMASFVGVDPPATQNLPLGAVDVKQNEEGLAAAYKRLLNVLPEEKAFAFCAKALGRSAGNPMTTHERRMVIRRIDAFLAGEETF